MKTNTSGMGVIGLLAFFLASCPAVIAQQTNVPQTLHYQGRVLSNGAPFTGTGHFVFAIFSNNSVIWNNWQGREAGVTLDPGSESAAPKMINPAATPLPVEVRNGLFSAILGKGDEVNQPIDSGVFLDSSNTVRQGMKLRVWFSQWADGPYARLDPDIESSPVPYAMVAQMAGTVRPGGLTAESLETDAVLATLEPGTALLSMNPVDPALQGNGFVRAVESINLGGQIRYVYKKNAAGVRRIALATADGDEAVDGQTAPLGFTVTDSPGQMVLTVRNLGNMALNGLGASIDGANAADFAPPSLGSTSVAPGGTTTLTVSANFGASLRRYANFHVTATGLSESFDVPLVAIRVAFVSIPAGPFMMGRTTGDADADAPPVMVTVSEFEIQTTEVSKAQWDEVRIWGLAHGYTFTSSDPGKADDRPVGYISWNEAVKWCNAYSEMQGRIPCYYLDPGQTVIFRTGYGNADNGMVKWTANGFRLPTEAEWEKAGRGGVPSKRYPWGTDTISHLEANYVASGTGFGNLSGNAGHHPDYPNSNPFNPVGAFASQSTAANGYGLHDMAGNVDEWCWDKYSASYYDERTDPVGPDSGTGRVYRGGSGYSRAEKCRAASRNQSGNAVLGASGFRVVRRSTP